MDVKGLSVKSKVSYKQKYPCKYLSCDKGNYVNEQSRNKVGHKALRGAHWQTHTHIHVRLFVKVAEHTESADKSRSSSQSCCENSDNCVCIKIRQLSCFVYLYHCSRDQHGRCHYVKNENYHHQLEVCDDVLPAVVKHCLAEKRLLCGVHADIGSLNRAVLRHNPSPPFRK